jgi:hypothetical protein
MEAKGASAQDDLAEHNGSSRIVMFGGGGGGEVGEGDVGGLQSYQYHAKLRR